MKYNTKIFIDKAQKVHGNKYDYSKVNYIDSQTKVCIVCLKHGEFWQKPSDHLQGKGCQKCNGGIQSTTEEFIKKAKEVHNNKYDYSKVEYKNSHTKVCIICPIHGEFWQDANHHLQGYGCPSCGGRKKRTTEEFIKKAKEIHGDKYDYSKVEYLNQVTPVRIICYKHGEFWQRPDKHLIGHGCQQCGKEKYTKSLTSTTDDFIRKARKIHGDKYDYSKVEYKHNAKKVCIICPTHGEFWQTPNNHLHGDRCPKCKMSKLEELFQTFCEQNNIEYEYQKHFKWLGRQSIDFYLPQYNIGIECQGKQHYTSIEYFGGEDGLKYSTERDVMKFKKCIDNNVKLLYILEENEQSPSNVIYQYNNTFNINKVLKEHIENKK